MTPTNNTQVTLEWPLFLEKANAVEEKTEEQRLALEDYDKVDNQTSPGIIAQKRQRLFELFPDEWEAAQSEIRQEKQWHKFWASTDKQKQQFITNVRAVEGKTPEQLRALQAYNNKNTSMTKTQV